jgi:menaquinone-dependent protoporphyrinogen IX oxidase
MLDGARGGTVSFSASGGAPMKIQYLHASKFGHGTAVAAEFANRIAREGQSVEVRHIREVRPTELLPADLYVFSSPGRFGKPIRDMRRFLKKLSLPAGTRYALLTTEAQPKPEKKTGRMPTDEELASYQRVRPIMDELLQGKGLRKVAEEKVYVTGLKGPLEEGWEKKVQAFATRVGAAIGERPQGDTRAPVEISKAAPA